MNYENVAFEETCIEGRKCLIYSHILNDETYHRDSGCIPCILWGTGTHEAEHINDVICDVEAGLFESMVRDREFIIVAYECKDWNGDYSPWKASAVFNDEGFAGNGQMTYDWLVEKCIPYIEEIGHEVYSNCNIKYMTVGYSLSGLFALWAWLKSGEKRGIEMSQIQISGAASCSGSLWYTGWMEYAYEHIPHKNSIVYFSLGEKEECTKNPIMSRVGDNTRTMADMYVNTEVERYNEYEKNVDKCILEMNKGGHFKNTAMRTVKGIKWLICNCS